MDPALAELKGQIIDRPISFGGAATFSMMTFGIMTIGILTMNIMTHNKMTLDITQHRVQLF